MAASIYEVGTLPYRSLLALVWTCFSVAFLFVGLRTVIRLKVTTRLTVEDYWIFMALAALLTLCILETIQLPSLYYVTGILSNAIPLSLELVTKTEEYLKYEFPIVIIFWTVLWSVKAAFLALYHKLFRELPIYRRVWYALVAFTFLGYVGCIITLCMSCRPTYNFFQFAKCGAERDVWAANLSVYYSTSIDVFTDLCVMAMPLKLIYNVKISAKQKAGLVCVFGLCFVMIAFSIIRAKQVLVPQQFVNLTLLMIWSTLAASISVIVGSLPALKLLITNRASTKRSRYGYGSNASASKREKQASKVRSNKSIELGSVENEKKPASDYCPEAGSSQEDILRSDGRSVIVKHDIVSSAVPYFSCSLPNHPQG
ncbi:hypothetical protein B0H63DRAFT_389341 [Podospora didyma]|uniref:Rhodopsin domain-containing protein n=1 Tax=Podospora didyma TaxID=330526 RepID=A0AAE0NXT1_9PEZI|nr:hypothetical protein B0H63DRAFT_389341 [Podospora didyma]